MKFGLTAAIAFIALLAGSIAVTASPLERRNTQNSTFDQTIANLQRINTTTLTGEVVQVQGDEFILRDATGELLVEAEFSAIRQANLKPGDRITVAGQVDDNSFEAFSLTPANRATIYVFDD